MQSYQVIYALVASGIASIVWLMLGKRDRLHPSLQRWVPILAVPVLTFLFQQSAGIARFLIEDVPVVSYELRRALAGRDFIEGEWPLVVVDAESGALMYHGFLTISHAGGQLKVEGRDWQFDGKPALDFESKQATYSDGRLQYWYVQGENGSMRGYTEIYFFPKHTLPVRQAGEFLDKQHKSVRFLAERRPTGPLIKPLTSEKERFAAAQAFWERIKPNIRKIVDRPVEMDWE